MRNPLRRHPGPDPTKPAPDERIWGRTYRGPAPWIFGLIMVVILAILSVLAYTKELPWADDGYTLEATFENAATLRETAPVRIAGVNVGEVLSVEADGENVKVTFNVDEDGQPIHADAEVEIRPRLFLEGNFFLDLFPGSPSAPELPSGGDIPVTQTATAVQLDEVLTALQAPQRRGLQELLEGYGTGLTYEPTAAADADQDPIVRGETAARSLNDAFRHGGDAGRGTAIVNTALLGENPGDLSGFIRSFGITFDKLASQSEDLSDLITNFNTFAGALATESANLSETLSELAPTLDETETSLAHLSDALPAARALAIESRPGIQELPQTIASATPWLRQARELMRDSELGGLSRELSLAAPGLAQTAAASPQLFNEQTLLGRCTSNVLVPTGDLVINDGFSSGQPNYNEFFYSAVNLAGAAQGFDGNGPYIRLQPGGGDALVQAPVPGGGFQNTVAFGNTIQVPDGVQPVAPAQSPPFRMEIPCHTNDVPNVNGPAGAAGPSDMTAAGP